MNLRMAFWAVLLTPLAAQTPGAGTGARELTVVAGKSVILDSPVMIQRVAVANPEVAEAVATNPREVLVNGKSVGETSVILWQEGGGRMIFDLQVQKSSLPLDRIRREIQAELPGQDVRITMDGDVPFVRGTVTDLTSAERAIAIAGTIGKPVNLLKVSVPPVDPQILIKVRFANVDRAATQELGMNLFSTGAANTIGAVSTQQFSSPQPTLDNTSQGGSIRFTFTDALNLFFFRPDLNLGATIKWMQGRRLLEILAEPNVLAINNKQASFLAGGEFPFPMLQGGGAGLGAVTIQFREFGVRINFLPTVTPRGTIRMQVTPEVSSLDFANGLVFQGFTIPALSTRRVQTEVELEDGQSFAIGGMLDNRVIENLSKLPGIGDIPFLGKLFRSRQLIKNNTELIVIITPELVRPMPAGMEFPAVKMPKEFMEPNTSNTAPRTPPIGVTGPVPIKPPAAAIPIEQLIQSQRGAQATGQQQAQPMIQFVPVVTPPQGTPQAPVTPPQRPPDSPGSTVKE